MIRKVTHYVLMSVLWTGMLACQEDDISTPPKPTLQANKTTAEVGEEITFTINEVNADAVSLLPYGLPGGDAGVLLNFSDGVATVGFSYDRPGTFDAVVVANNHSGDGEKVQNVTSTPVTVTITSSAHKISAFRFITIKETATEFDVVDVSTKTTIDQDAGTIDVIVPYGTDLSKLVAAFDASGYSTVTVNGTEQKSEETVNDFQNPVTYTITAADGTAIDYTVTVHETPVEVTTAIKSIAPVAVSESADEKELGAAVDTVGGVIVVYDTLGTPSEQFDSVRVGYELKGAFAILKYGDTVMKQDSLLDLTSTQTLDVYSQDSSNTDGIKTYTVYATDAPKLALSFPLLTPDPAAGVEPTNFDFAINVLKGTDVSSINTVATTEDPPGVTVIAKKVNGKPFVSGTAVDYSKPVQLELIVDDPRIGVTYSVTYTITVTVIQ